MSHKKHYGYKKTEEHYSEKMYDDAERKSVQC